MRAISVLLALGWYALLARIGVRATCECGRRGPLAATSVRATAAAVASGWRVLGRASDKPGAMACGGCVAKARARSALRIACITCPATITGRDQRQAEDTARSERWRRSSRGWVCSGCTRDPLHTSLAEPWEQAVCACGATGPQGPTLADARDLATRAGWSAGRCSKCARGTVAVSQ